MAQEAPANACEFTAQEFDQIRNAEAIATSFLAAATKGDLTTARSLCTRKIDPEAPSAGDGDEVLAFESGKDLREAWSPLKCKVQSIGLQRRESGKLQFIIVWLRPTVGEWTGDIGLVVSPKTKKIVSIFDGSE